MSDHEIPELVNFKNNPSIGNDLKELLGALIAYSDQKTLEIKQSIEETNKTTYARLDNIEARVRALEVAATDTDPSSVKLVGFPRINPENYDKYVQHFINFLGCPRIMPHVIAIREWKRTPQQPSGPNSPPSPFTLVVKFSSPTVRDEVMSHKATIVGKTQRDIFSNDSNTRVYMDPLNTSRTHQIATKARWVAKKHQLPGPLIRGNLASLRRTPQSTLTPLYTEADLVAFEKSLPLPQPPTERDQPTLPTV